MIGTVARLALGGLVSAALVLASIPTASAQKLKIGVVSQTPAAAGFHIADVLGYFKDEGLDVDISKFDGGSLSVTALVSGAVDVATVGYTAAFFNTAKNGDLKVIGGGVREVPGFSSAALLASNQAVQSGLKTMADLKGRKVGLNSLGTALQYSLILMARKHGFEIPTSNIVILGTHGNLAAAVKSNAVDAVLTLTTVAMEAERRGEGKLITRVGDEAPWTLTGIFTRGPVIQKRRDDLVKMMRAVLRATKDYDAAFQQKDAAGKMIPGKDADKLYDIISQRISIPVPSLKTSMVYFEPDLNIDPAELAQQLATWKTTGMVSKDIDSATVVDASILQRARTPK